MTTVHDEEHHAHMGFCNQFDIVISLLLVCKIIEANNVTESFTKMTINFSSSFFFFSQGQECPVAVKVIPKLIAFCYDCIFIKYTPCIEYNNRVYVCGHKYVLGPTQTHFSPSRQATINITLEGIEKIKTEKNDNKTV